MAQFSATLSGLALASRPGMTGSWVYCTQDAARQQYNGDEVSGLRDSCAALSQSHENFHGAFPQ